MYGRTHAQKYTRTKKTHTHIKTKLAQKIQAQIYSFYTRTKIHAQKYMDKNIHAQINTSTKKFSHKLILANLKIIYKPKAHRWPNWPCFFKLRDSVPSPFFDIRRALQIVIIQV